MRRWTIQITYPMTLSGIALKLTQYIVFDMKHLYIFTLGTMSGHFAHYLPIFTAIAGSAQEFSTI